MKNKVYTLIQQDKNYNITSVEISNYSLPKIVDKFIKGDDLGLFIISSNAKKTKQKNEKSDIEKFYLKKYNLFYKRCKSKKITEEEFKEIIIDLKRIKSQSTTLDEFELKVSLYEETLI